MDVHRTHMTSLQRARSCASGHVWRRRLSSVAAALLAQNKDSTSSDASCVLAHQARSSMPDQRSTVGRRPPHWAQGMLLDQRTLADARRVAESTRHSLLCTVQFQERCLQDRSSTYFEDEYHAGRTPNPCVRCNDWLKFGKTTCVCAPEHRCFPWVASGHSRTDRIRARPQRQASQRGVDDGKRSESYVLFGAKLVFQLHPRTTA